MTEALRTINARQDRLGYLAGALRTRKTARQQPGFRPILRAYLDAAASARRRERDAQSEAAR